MFIIGFIWVKTMREGMMLAKRKQYFEQKNGGVCFLISTFNL